MSDHIERIFEIVVDGEMDKVEAAVEEALSSGLPAEEILKTGLISAMDEVGALFEEGQFFVPEMMISARTMQKGLETIRPLLVETGVKATGTLVIGTVSGDLHDIGKNLVAMMFEGAGFDVYDLGVDVKPEAFVEQAKEQGADIIGLSALLTTTLPSMERTIKALTEAGLTNSAKVIVGGAPVNPEFANKIGAHGYARDASRAVVLAKELMSA